MDKILLSCCCFLYKTESFGFVKEFYCSYFHLLILKIIFKDTANNRLNKTPRVKNPFNKAVNPQNTGKFILP
jgi:hypothetical protein